MREASWPERKYAPLGQCEHALAGLDCCALSLVTAPDRRPPAAGTGDLL